MVYAIIPATLKTEIWGIVVWGKPKQNLMRPHLSKQASVVVHTVVQAMQQV
jgi:hypothetical protein